MRGIVEAVMRGRIQASLAAILTAALAFAFTPAVIISGAIIVLSTLRNGSKEGLLIATCSILFLATLDFIFNSPQTFLLYGVIIWIPAWFLGSILGLRQSLSSTLEVAAVLAFFIVGAQYLFLGDPITFWSQILRNYLEIQINASVLSTNQSEEIISGFSGWMAGGVAASWFIASSLSIFLGYWAHALLEEKLFFGEDFRKIRASLLWLIVLPLMLCISFFIYDGKPSIIGQLSLVGLSLFLLQGLSLFHSLVFSLGKKIGWLIGLYFLLLFGAPSSMTVIAVAGYADGWLNLRVKFKKNRS